jgi:hypothetical protein
VAGSTARLAHFLDHSRGNQEDEERENRKDDQELEQREAYVALGKIFGSARVKAERRRR